MEPWELGARERIRDTLVVYNWSGDGLRLEELAATFHPDGELELRGREPVRGREAIVAFLGGVSPGRRPAPPAGDGPRRIVRHLLTNTRFVELTPERALVASYFAVLTEVGLDHYGRYRDTLRPAGGDAWLIRHRYVSTDWWAPDSTMPPAPSG